jgi:formylmethanofuran dehydrogenase subunit B
MGAAGNLAGAEAVRTWQGGFLQGVEYRLGVPTPLNEIATLEEALRLQEIDALVAIGSSLPDSLSQEARRALSTIPRIRIGPGATLPRETAATVAIATATAGFDDQGSVTRTDGVVLPTRALAEPNYPTERAIIRSIIEAYFRLAPSAAAS